MDSDTAGIHSYMKLDSCPYYREIAVTEELKYGGQLNGNYMYNGYWWKVK